MHHGIFVAIEKKEVMSCCRKRDTNRENHIKQTKLASD